MSHQSPSVSPADVSLVEATGSSRDDGESARPTPPTRNRVKLT
ncbi:MAG TPA: hypothetical protein VJ749_01150 [Pyrinomonadaceae bacterium]|nr:hypothetical protein [Pyrinomonadaceae bacterium]